MKKLKVKPIWDHKRYSVGYFIEGLEDIKMIFRLSLHYDYFWDGILGVLNTFVAMIKGKPLKYILDKEK